MICLVKFIGKGRYLLISGLMPTSDIRNYAESLNTISAFYINKVSLLVLILQSGIQRNALLCESTEIYYIFKKL